MIGADASGGAWWCPALRDVAEIAWSHDGASIAVLSQTPKIGFHDARSFIDVCSATGSRHVATVDNATTGIGWINDDKDLVFLSTTSSVLMPDHVWTVGASGGTPIDRTPNLNGSALQLSVNAKGNAWVVIAHGVKSEVDDVLVEEPVDPGEAKHGVREQLQRAIDKPDIQPIARPGPPGVESNEAPFINFIDEIFSAQKRENVGPNAFERINLLR